jgi:hypothetical protein
MLKYMFGKVTLFNLAWWLYAIGLALNIRRALRPPLLFINALFFLQISLYVFAYMITPSDLIWHLSTSLERVLMHLVPLSMFASAVNIRDCLGMSGEAPISRD